MYYLHVINYYCCHGKPWVKDCFCVSIGLAVPQRYGKRALGNMWADSVSTCGKRQATVPLLS